MIDQQCNLAGRLIVEVSFAAQCAFSFVLPMFSAFDTHHCVHYVSQVNTQSGLLSSLYNCAIVPFIVRSFIKLRLELFTAISIKIQQSNRSEPHQIQQYQIYKSFLVMTLLVWSGRSWTQLGNAKYNFVRCQFSYLHWAGYIKIKVFLHYMECCGNWRPLFC